MKKNSTSSVCECLILFIRFYFFAIQTNNDHQTFQAHKTNAASNNKQQRYAQVELMQMLLIIPSVWYVFMGVRRGGRRWTEAKSAFYFVICLWRLIFPAFDFNFRLIWFRKMGKSTKRYCQHHSIYVALTSVRIKPSVDTVLPVGMCVCVNQTISQALIRELNLQNVIRNGDVCVNT